MDMEFNKDTDEVRRINPSDNKSMLLQMLNDVAEQADNIEAIVILTKTTNSRISTGALGDLDNLDKLLEVTPEFRMSIDQRRAQEAIEHLEQCEECRKDPEQMERLERLRLLHEEIKTARALTQRGLGAELIKEMMTSLNDLRAAAH